MSEEEIFGPIDFVLIEYPGDKLDGSAAEAVMDLVERGIVRIWDAIIVQKNEDGTFSGLEIQELDADSVGSFTAFAGARSGLVGDEDIAEAASALAPGTVAALLVYENTWAIPFVAASRAAGGQVVATARIPAETVMEAIEALED